MVRCPFSYTPPYVHLGFGHAGDNVYRNEAPVVDLRNSGRICGSRNFWPCHDTAILGGPECVLFAVAFPWGVVELRYHYRLPRGLANIWEWVDMDTLCVVECIQLFLFWIYLVIQAKFIRSARLTTKLNKTRNARTVKRAASTSKAADENIPSIEQGRASNLRRSRRPNEEDAETGRGEARWKESWTVKRSRFHQWMLRRGPTNVYSYGNNQRGCCVRSIQPHQLKPSSQTLSSRSYKPPLPLDSVY